MKIFSKKTFRFDMKEQKSVTIKAMEFKNVPDWVKDTLIFKLASKDGTIQEIVSKKQSLALENDGETPEEKELRNKAKELKIKNYQRLGIEELKQKITEKEEENQKEKQGEN